MCAGILFGIAVTLHSNMEKADFLILLYFPVHKYDVQLMFAVFLSLSKFINFTNHIKK